MHLINWAYLAETQNDPVEAHIAQSPDRNVRVDMDAAELIDPRPNDDAPLAFWHNRLVLSVHHDGAGAMPTESKIMTGHLLRAIIFRLPVSPLPPMNPDAEYWLATN